MLLPHRHGRTERVTERVPERVTDDQSVFFTQRVAERVPERVTERVTERVAERVADDESVFFTERVTDECSNGVDSLGRAAAYGKVRLDSLVGANLQGLCDQSGQGVRGRLCCDRVAAARLLF